MGISKEICKNKEVQLFTSDQLLASRMKEDKSFKRRNFNSSNQMAVAAEATAEIWISQVSNLPNNKPYLRSINVSKRLEVLVSGISLPTTCKKAVIYPVVKRVM